MSEQKAREIYQDIGDEVQSFIRRYCEDELGDLLQKYPNEKSWFAIDWTDIHTWEPNVADDFLTLYEDFKLVFEWAIQDVDKPLDIDLDDVSVWLYNLPPDYQYSVGEPRAENVGDYLSMQGMIKKVGSVKFDAKELAFECQRCGTLTYIPQPSNDYQEPHECQGCDRQGPFHIDFGSSEFEDRLLLQLTQPVEEVPDGEGEKIEVVLRKDLEKWFTDRGLSSGARITVNGLFKLDKQNDGKDSAFGAYLHAHNIEVEEHDYEEIDTSEHLDTIQEYAVDPEIFSKLVASLAPDIRGGQKMKDIKLGIVLQLFGGYRRQKPDGTFIRGDSHILLIGDPSTGKSSLLDAVEEIAPRAVSVSGKGASAAGMTAAAVKDSFGDGQFNLEAGALALANGGVAAVDEIGRMQDDAVDSMHAALEKQIISVNKAGINARIPARTSLLAAGNPKYDRFDPYENIYEQVELDDALWSRFDLAFILQDEQDEEKDTDIAEGKVQAWQESARVDRGELDPEDADSLSPEIDHETLRAYIAYAKRNIRPVVSDEAGEEIVDYYVNIRGEGDEETPSLAARKLEGIRRLAEASARVRLSETITVDDVERAKRVIGRSLADVGMNEDGEFDADIMETGRSSSQRKRIRNLKQLVAELEEGTDNGAPEDDVIERAVNELQMDSGKVEHEIEKLKMEKGDLYEPTTGFLRTS